METDPEASHKMNININFPFDQGKYKEFDFIYFVILYL